MTSTRLRFDSIEEAHEYVNLLSELVLETRSFVCEEIAQQNEPASRQEQALRIVVYKLEQLGDHLRRSSRLLNDLRTLRRALYGERNADVEATFI